ncbi:hypothetical protein B0H13DRAFT_1920274 [Mycena leptocephala]|nr:hypothetical protein B0H13DRAFT_1920274 [Mycena leptocephala]
MTQISRRLHTIFEPAKCNQFNKNTDPDDISLCAGNGYFPPSDEYKAYLAKIPVSREKSTCNYLNVVNKQDKKKMAITGTVNLLTFNMANGNVDKICHLYLMTDEHFPDLVEDISSMRWGVPSLHVQGHQDSCNYLWLAELSQCTFIPTPKIFVPAPYIRRFRPKKRYLGGDIGWKTPRRRARRSQIATTFWRWRACHMDRLTATSSATQWRCTIPSNSASEVEASEESRGTQSVDLALGTAKGIRQGVDRSRDQHGISSPQLR